MLKFLLPLLLTTLAACSSSEATDKVSLEQARAALQADQITLIDIRETPEHRTGVAKGALLLPMSQMAQKIHLMDVHADKPIYLICNTQNRSKAILQELKKRGYQNVHYVEGGMSAWTAKGWPLVHPQP